MLNLLRVSSDNKRIASVWRGWLFPRFLLSISLIASISGIGILSPITSIAAHEGEQTADIIPVDTEVYITINLDPSEDQYANLWRSLNNWWADATVQDRWDTLIQEGVDETNINIEDDVLPIIGPELAMGTRAIDSALEASMGTGESSSGNPSQQIVLIGTQDKAASDSLFFNKFAPWLAEEVEVTTPSSTTGTYEGIATLYEFPDDENFWAFADDYIVWANDQTYLEASLDLISGKSTDSLSDTSDFQQAQEALPSDRTGMLYYNYVTDILDNPPEDAADWVTILGSGIIPSTPSYIAATLEFTPQGMSSTGYAPFAEGSNIWPSDATDHKSAGIAPEDAILFISGENPKGYWEWYESEINQNWDEFFASLPEDMQTECADCEDIDALINKFFTDSSIDINLDNDLFGWMTGEFGIAELPLSFDAVTGELQPGEFMVMFEVNDTSAVQTNLEKIIDELSTALSQDEEDVVSLDKTQQIGGVDATLIKNDSLDENNAFSLGWLFLDMDDTHFLVFGSTQNALAEAVNAANNTSLADSADYKAVISELPEDMSLLIFLDIADLLEDQAPSAQKRELDHVQDAVDELMEAQELTTIIGVQTPTKNMNAFPDTSSRNGQGWSIYSEGSYSYYSGETTTWTYTCDNNGTVTQHDIAEDDIELLTNSIPSQFAIGYGTIVGNSAITMNGAIHILPPPLSETSVPEGDTQDFNIPETSLDLSQIDSDIDQVSVEFTVDIQGAPADANIQTSIMKEAPDSITEGFELAATDEGLNIVDVAYVVQIDTSSLGDATTSNAVITLKVGTDWADEQGTDNIRIIRVTDDGEKQQILDTEFVGYTDDDTQAIFKATSTDGLSYFALVSTETTALDLAIIVAIVGGAIVLTILLLFILRRRSSAV
ncbi:MAG: DUF3352 domain-containing protein [Chloroflexota bacterium]|nr:DUF3352 domain-containing protein [Chloroflexota bacterium]